MKKILLLTAAVMLFSLPFASCKKKERTLYLYNWTYYTPDEVIEDFQEEFNCVVNVDSYASNEDMYAKLQAGAEGYDIVVPSQDFCSIMIAQGIFQPLDQSKMTNKVHINPQVFEKSLPHQVYCLETCREIDYHFLSRMP